MSEFQKNLASIGQKSHGIRRCLGSPHCFNSIPLMHKMRTQSCLQDKNGRMNVIRKVIKSKSFKHITSLMSVNQCCLETNGVEDSMAIWTLTLALIFSKLCMAMQDSK